MSATVIRTRRSLARRLWTRAMCRYWRWRISGSEKDISGWKFEADFEFLPLALLGDRMATAHVAFLRCQIGVAEQYIASLRRRILIAEAS